MAWINASEAARAAATRNSTADPRAAGLVVPRIPSDVYAALDLGTNNCRLLIARPWREGFRILDAFSRIVRLGEGLAQNGRLGEAAIRRTLAALEVCREKMDARGVTRARLIATEACRSAANGADFIARVQDETGLALEIVDRETEAHLAAAGCAALADAEAEGVVLFDIGGGSSEIVWLARPAAGLAAAETDLRQRVRVWASLQLGVVTLAERFGGDRSHRRDIRSDDRPCRRTIGGFRPADGRRSALPALPSARDIGYRDDGSRYSSRPCPLRPSSRRRPVDVGAAK